MNHKLVAMLRIKNQIITISECLSRLSDLVDEIVIVDNGSTDGTLEVYGDFKKVVVVKKTKGFDEGRDKVFALELAKERKPDWIIWIDGDEIIEEWVSRKDLDMYMEQNDLYLIKFRMFNFWKSKETYRIDGKWFSYTAAPQRMMWRNVPEAYFDNLPFHNGGIRGVSGKHILSEIRIKHFGYINDDQIITKNRTYKSLEQDKQAFKTMSTSEKYLKLQKWVSGKSAALNQKKKWDTIERNQKLCAKLRYIVKHYFKF
jgi:glycosyltransferase involved in cell wall biosynthesis